MDKAWGWGGENLETTMINMDNQWGPLQGQLGTPKADKEEAVTYKIRKRGHQTQELAVLSFLHFSFLSF